MAEVISRERSATSPTINKAGTHVEVPVQDTIPIIFFPGIMGSNLKTKDNGKSVWKLGNGLAIVGTVKDQMSKSPTQLQKELDPKNTLVDNNGTIKVDSRLKLTEKVLRERGWGTVHWGSYGSVLTYLQINLNNIGFEATLSERYGSTMGGASVAQRDKMVEYAKEWNSLLDPQESRKWNPQNSLVKITKDDISHLKKFNFPVYAMGYNWLQSCGEGAKLASLQLDAIKKSLGNRFHKFIIVTHSMGGLVARSLVQLKSSDIAGVISNVMPAEGAPLAYRRIVTGAIDAGVGASLVMGPSAAHMTAVLGNAPGGLELLPTRSYHGGSPWLHLKGFGHTVSLPSSGNPYNEIYKADGVWWEMVKEELLDPLNRDMKSPKKGYNKRIGDVETFHNSILGRYHPNTYISYGHDSKQRSFGRVTWTLDKNLTGISADQLKRLPRVSQEYILKYNAKVINDATKQSGTNKYARANLKVNNDGVRYVLLSNGIVGTFNISDSNADGDGTVSFHSGRAPLGKSGVKQVFQMTGFNHQKGVANGHVRRSILYSIVKIIKDNNIQPKFR